MKRLLVLVIAFNALAGCARKEVAPTAFGQPTTTYTKSFELHYPGKGVTNYTDWTCTVEAPPHGYREVFTPSRNIGIDGGVSVDFAMTIPLFRDTEYIFTTTYRLDGALKSRVAKSVISEKNER